MLKVQNLTKIYGTQKAVNDISFEAKAGEIVGFLGPNGAGKSTTMKIATGFLTATAGNVEVNGFDVKKYRQCTFVAKDGMTMIIPFDEITDNQAFLTFTAEKKGEKKELKLIMLQDPYEQRWLKYINKIILE